jgi:hypothetical protein
VALKLFARGRVRSEEGTAAIEIHQYEFRISSASNSNGPTLFVPVALTTKRGDAVNLPPPLRGSPIFFVRTGH